MPSPYDSWPAFAPIVEAMSGIYELKRRGDDPPLVAPVGALGDIGSGLFAVIGVLAALRHRDATGRGQHVDIAMLDAMVAMTDIVTNFWSLGLRGGDVGGADHGRVPGRPTAGSSSRSAASRSSPRWPSWSASPSGRPTRASPTGRAGSTTSTTSSAPPSRRWAAGMTRLEACAAMSAAGIAAGPCFRDDEVVADPHVAARNMLVEMPRTDGVDEPVLVPGNPVKLTNVAEGPETRIPWLGEHTDAVLAEELGLGDAELADAAGRRHHRLRGA